jgi:DNA-directed RNA polymerase specialized sigma24 family protein
VSAARDRLRIGEALAELSAVDRDVLRRSYYQGWTTAQIAHDLHIPEGTVKMKLHTRCERYSADCRKWGFRTRQPSSRIGPYVTPVRGDVANLDDLDLL